MSLYKQTLLFIILFWSSPIYAITVCEVIDIAGEVEQRLQRFDRVNNEFHYDGNLMEIDGLNDTKISVPKIEYTKTRVIEELKKNNSIYENDQNEIVMTVINLNYELREQIKLFINNRSLNSFSKVHIFEFVKWSLGKDKVGFCNNDIEKSVSMLMASAISPTMGIGTRKDIAKVYIVNNLNSVMISRDNGKYLEFVFPDISDINRLIYVQIHDDVEKIKESLVVQ